MEMDITDNNTTKDSGLAMGNEVSHSAGVKQSVGGGGKTGQFHRVLVESDYAVPDLREPVVTEDIHHQKTSETSGTENEAELKTDDSSEKEKEPDTPGDNDYSLIEECKALISEAANRAVQRSLSRSSKSEEVTDIDEIRAEGVVEEVHVIDQAKSVNLTSVLPSTSCENSHVDIYENIKSEVEPSEVKTAKVESEVAETVKKSEADVSYALKCGFLTGSTEDIFEDKTKENKGKKGKSKSADNIFQREVIESVKEHFENEDNLETDTNQTTESKRSKGSFIAKMFKFSKRKPRADAEVPVDIKTQIKEDIVEEIVHDNNAQPTKSEDSDVNSNEQSNKRNHEIRRLNSLDSGIVVDKCGENANNGGVEYAVVQKPKRKIKDLIKTNNDTSSESKNDGETIVPQVKVTETISGDKVDTKSENKEVVYINGDRVDEDFVYINERAVDVDGLVEQSKVTETETKPSENVGIIVNTAEEKQTLDDERQSTVSNDSGTSYGSVIKRSDMLAPDKAKLKKKSWSFQLGGKKKPSDDMECKSVVSMDPNASQTVEPKKSRWRFGKFSFRKGSDDVSSSTPNLHNAGIPEDEVVMRQHSNDKKKTKLKKIKAKKEKKRSPKKSSSSLDQRSISMIEIGQGQSLAPRNRRSIVEEDLQYTQTDVFEGVSLSDLSQDEEAEVSTNPAGGKGVANKSSSKKEETTVLDKTLYKIKSAVVAKSEKVVAKQPSLELPTTDNAVSQEADNSKLTKSDSVEDSAVTNAEDITENNETKSKGSLNHEHIDDEYVNIIDTKLQRVHSASTGSNEKAENMMEEVEYAQVIKTKAKEEVYENIDKTKQTVQSCVPVQMLRLDTVKVLNAETSEADNQPITTETNENVELENTEQEKQISEEKEVVKSGETAFSNMIYSDEEFRATLASKINTKTDIESEETLADKIKTKTDIESEDENGAYVELQQVVDNFTSDKEITQDQVDEKNEININLKDSGSDEKIVETVANDVYLISSERADKTEPDFKGVEVAANHFSPAFTGNADEIVQDDKGDVSDNIEPVVIEKTNSVEQESETVKPVIEEVEKQMVKEVESGFMALPDVSQTREDSENDIQETVIKTNKEGSVIVLKDVGVQVPDIYMPLDKEKDFGFTANNVPCVSIGIQVTDKDLDIEHVVVSMNKDDDKENVSPAFF